MWIENDEEGTSELNGLLFKGYCNNVNHHQKSKFYFLNIQARREFSCENNDVETYVCKKCDFTTYHLIIFKQHIKTFHNKLDSNVYNVKKYSCTCCPFETYFRLLLEKHENGGCLRWKVSQDPELQCTECPKKFVSQHFLEQHCFNKHLGEIQWTKCNQCDYKTKFRENLRKHVTYKHKPIDEIEGVLCSFCGVKLRYKYQLRVHTINKHTALDEIRWFYCKHCDYKCKMKSQLNSHVRNKHTTEDEIHWFKCDNCNYKSKTKGNLQAHTERRHSDL